MMNWEEVNTIAKSKFLIGAHSCNHKELSFLDGKDQENEIKNSINIKT